MALSDKEIEKITFKYYKEIYGFCCGQCSNPEAARDITQETFLTLVKKKDQLNDDNIRAWLYKTAANKTMESFREQERSAEMIDFAEVEEKVGTVDDTPVFDDVQEKILSVLNEYEKRLFTLLFIEKQNISVIMDETGFSANNIYQQKHRIRKKIKSKFKYSDFFMLVLAFKMFGMVWHF